MRREELASIQERLFCAGMMDGRGASTVWHSNFIEEGSFAQRERSTGDVFNAPLDLCHSDHSTMSTKSSQPDQQAYETGAKDEGDIEAPR